MIGVDVAFRYSLAVALAYRSANELSSGTSQYQQQLQPYYRFHEQVTVDDLCASATIFESAVDDGETLVAFRGSTAVQNYLSMFNLRLVPSTLGCAGRVHAGYQDASTRLYARLQPSLAQAKRTVFVGHSYGGGTATMCALLHPDVSALVTYAGPRVGDATFARAFNDKLGARTTHLVHDLDPVLAQNQPLWNALGFVHTGSLVRCACREPRLLDANEESSGLPWNFADHAEYLGTTMGP